MLKLRGGLKLVLGVVLLSPMFISAGVGLGLKHKASTMRENTYISFLKNKDEDYQSYLVERDKQMDNIYKAYFNTNRNKYNELSDYYAYAPFMFDYVAKTEKYGSMLKEADHLEEVSKGVLYLGTSCGFVVSAFSEGTLNDFIYKDERGNRGFYHLFKSAAADLKYKKKEEETIEISSATTGLAEQNS